MDAVFLHQEDGGAHMDIGGLRVFAGPPPLAFLAPGHTLAVAIVSFHGT